LIYLSYSCIIVVVVVVFSLVLHEISVMQLLLCCTRFLLCGCYCIARGFCRAVVIMLHRVSAMQLLLCCTRFLLCSCYCVAQGFCRAVVIVLHEVSAVQLLLCCTRFLSCGRYCVARVSRPEIPTFGTVMAPNILLARQDNVRKILTIFNESI